MRILGIDFGDRNIGLALSDSLRLTAQPLGTYQFRDREDADKKFFGDLVRKHEIGEIVCGIPLRMDGSSGTRAEKTRVFARWLEQAVGVPVRFWDERLTTRQAIHVMHEQKVKLSAKKSVVNQISATIILQTYLDSQRADAHVSENH
ncbi:MAG: Holliday junction resolvase RuvX [Candidatus Aminicenantes bacterium]|jgi:putative Holliday junction resolvase|nr:Holliday junction resolvase RuvX [Candidatus Aminicenantes bacterium]